MGTITVGTSSWADQGFVEEWYPKRLAAGERLAWYAQRFDGVELNASFYAIPDPNLVARWATTTTPRFTFDWKLHQALSRHATSVNSLPPDLRDDVRVTSRGRVEVDQALEQALAQRTLEAARPLREAHKLNAFLLQLSPSFSPAKHRLDELAPVVRALAPVPVAIELRHRGWVAPDRLEATLDSYEQLGAVFVCVDAPQGDAPTMMPPVDAVTRDDLAYMRMHGRNADGYLRGKSVAERFAWDYTDDELRELVVRAQGLAADVRDVRMYFNNNRGADAPRSARRARELLGQDPGPDPDEPEPAQETLL